MREGEETTVIWSQDCVLGTQEGERREEMKKGLQDQKEVARRMVNSNMLPMLVKPGNE